ncbi:MAG: formate dehydrogenase subunit alpha [Archaeoglobus sp.]|nr:MAG: formate dehydrogenase subunit alpha [Archaeoglobus sp.]
MSVNIIDTVCPYCGVGCGISLSVRDGRIAGVEPMKYHPVNEGKLCIKGRYCFEFVHRKDRLRSPLVRKNDGFCETSWQQVLKIVAERLLEYRDEIGFLSSAKCTNEENYIIQKFARVLGTNNIDHCARLCHAPTVVGLGEAFGSGAMTNSIRDIEESRCILIVGSNTFEQHPLIARRILRAKNSGAKIIVVDPRRTITARIADLFLQIYPGTNVALLNGMANVILKKELFDYEFIKKRTKGFEKFLKSIEKYTPEFVSKICGVEAKLIEDAAKIYAESERSTIIYCMGVTQFAHGTDNVRACCNLALLTGNIGKPGTGINPLRGQNNVQGACDMGALPDFFPGYQRISDSKARKKFEELWGCELSDETGLTVTEMIDEAGKKIKSIYIMGENPVVSDPDTCHVEKCLKKLDFLVVQDIFLSETAKLADVILPACCWAEKEGTFTNTERRVQLIRKAVEPPGKSMPDYRIISAIAGKAGLNGFDYSSAEEIFNEIRTAVPQYAGITYSRLGSRGIQWPCPTENHPGTPILHTEDFATPDGRGCFSAVEYMESAEKPDENYPFILTTGRIVFHYHTGTMTRNSPHLAAEINECFAELNIEDAERAGLRKGDIIKVTSRRGEITAKVRLSNIKKGVVFIPFHFSESPANRLTQRALDRESKIPELKVCTVKINKFKKK